MKHSFFKDLDFKKVINLEIQPEWKPELTDILDVTNFDEEFTKMGNL
jgi:hypothetical protein